METTNRERHNAPPTDDGTRVAYAEASKAARAAASALEDALGDAALIPAALLAPPVERNGESVSRPWSARGVTAPRARRVLDYASRQYLAGYSKVEAGRRWTRSSGEAPHLPLIRQTCRALGIDETSASNRRAVGATYGYLAALGILDYEPGRGERYAHLAYGPVALAGRSLARPSHRVSGGIAQQRARGSSPAAGYTKRGSIREKKSPTTSQTEPVAQRTEGSERETSNNGKTKSNTSGVRLTRAGGLYLDALYEQLGKYGPRYARRLYEAGYRDHGALIAQANAYGRIAEPHGESGYRVAVARLDLGTRDNLDKAGDLPSTLAAIMKERRAEVEARLAPRQPAYEETYTEYHYGEEPEAVRAEDPAPLAAALGHLYPEPEPVVLDLPEGEAVGADPRTTVEAYAIAAGSAVAEVRPAYETGEPLRSRLILEAVRQGAHLGYGIPEEEAVALHAHYLDLRQAGTLDPEQDLPEIQTALQRPLHLAEVALYGLSLRVSAAEWEQAETSTYTGGAAYPERVEVREVSLAGTAVAP